MHLLILGMRGILAAIREGVSIVSERLAAFERNAVSNLGDAPAGLVELAVLVASTFGRAGIGVISFILMSLILALFFLLR